MFDVKAWLAKMCTEAERVVPTESCAFLFRGSLCQYTGKDKFCTGTFIDCRRKGNEAHFGGTPKGPK